uniref:Protein kinase domain-containing protein n=1 Tax=Meloidogyne javanica TaxID=6303 RepID=A0A915LSZ7_MELJA
MASTLKMNLGTCKNILNSTYIEGFPEPVIKIIAKNVLKGLMFLHSNGIIHRGVCAQNILLDTEGEIRLAITQNAIKIKDCPRWIGQLNRVHSFAGLEDSFVWLAPEVLRQDLNGYGIESDIYSFGIFICELSNGIAPFAEMEPLRILYEKLRGTTPFLMDSQTSENGKVITINEWL